MISIWKSILEWYRNNRKTLRLSLLVSLAITIFSYEVANSLHPIAGEYATTVSCTSTCVMTKNWYLTRNRVCPWATRLLLIVKNC